MNQKQLADLLVHLQEGFGDLLKKKETEDLQLLSNALMEQPDRSLKALSSVIAEKVALPAPNKKSSSSNGKAKAELTDLKKIWEAFDHKARTTFEDFEQEALVAFNAYTQKMLVQFWQEKGFPIGDKTDKQAVVKKMINQLKSVRGDLQRAENVRLAATR